MDLSMLKQKLDTLQQKQTPKQSTDYSTIFWRPTIGKQQIRIVPSAFNSKNPFTELKFYYGITNKVMISPQNFGEKDPIQLFAQKLREGEYNRENYVLAKKLDAKTRIFAPVLVRGEEDKGVRLWQFGKLIYEELLSLAVDEEIGDYTDIASGRDITVETVGPEATGTPYNKSSVRVRLKTSPLSEDSTTVEKWLSPEDANEEGEVISEPAVPFDDKPKSSFSLDTSNVKKSKEDAFDDLFDEDKSSKTDDLPF